MKMSVTILAGLRDSGFRITKARSAMVEAICDANAPLAASDLLSELAEDGLRVNKTTVYRELDFLKEQRIVRELDIGDGRKRFELWPHHHHHHLICTSCHMVECIELQRCLKDEHEHISRTSSFKVKDHSLKFFGLCERCQ
ncbi:Fur family transcriptional regulator [Nitrospirota bacterium]